MKSIIICLLCLLSLVVALNNGLALTPPLGISTLSQGCSVNEESVKKEADLLASSGLLTSGFKYILVEDCWQLERDSISRRLKEDPNKFPSGLSSLINYIHGKGLLIGLGTDIGTLTRSGKPGSSGFEKLDAQTFAGWGIDMVKLSNSQNLTSSRQRLMIMSQYLIESGRKMLISVDNNGKDNVASWGGSISNTWRTADQIKATWASLTKTVLLQNNLDSYSGSGSWNDPGYLRTELPLNEFTAQFVLWAGLKAPMTIDNKLETLEKAKLNLFLNEELVNINQDSLKKQMKLIRDEQYAKGSQQIWGGPLSGNRYLLVFFNQMTEVVSMQLSLLKQANVQVFKSFFVRDPINRSNYGTSTSDIFSIAKVQGHSVEARILTFQY